MNVPTRTRRIKKSKIIEDLGFETSPKNLSNKKIKKHKTYYGQFKSNKDSKICIKLFTDFKSLNVFYHEFALFTKIEKKIKNNLYSHYTEFANEMRNTFSQYFLNYSNNIEKYNELFTLCESFENIYKEYDNKIFTKESKNLIEIKKRLSKLRKELKDTYHTSPQYLSNSKNLASNTNRLKISLNGELITSNNSFQKSTRKFKVDLANKIRNLTPQQKKGIVNIISKAYLDKTNNDIMEIDVNKMPLGQLRELEKYVEECRGNTEEFLTETPINNTQKTNCELNKEKELFEELSESLSSDDDDDSSDMLD